MLMIGIVLIIGGGIGFVAMLLGSAIIGIGGLAAAGLFGVCLLVGIFMVGGTVFSGLMENKKLGTATTVTTIQDCTVQARFAINELGEMLFSDFDPEFVKLYVRLKPPTGRVLELKTAMPTWESAPEGVKGTATVQGDWLGKFEMVRPTPAANQDPYRSD